jgi:multidrug resistance efflux pump
LWAAVIEARAQVERAKSDRDRVYAGVRGEEVAVLQQEILKAQAARLLASQELQRKAYLAARSDVSRQEADIAQATWARADADVAVAEARYAEAKLGPTTEERALADAQVTAAEAARDVIEARAAKMLLHAPVPGVIGTLVAELGEAIRPGETILTVLPDQGAWFGFDVREDRLGDVTVGTSVALTAARLKEPITAKVSELRNWGEFATWRAARASGDHDLNTFFLRLDPITQAVPLEPGQTVWLSQLK